MPAFEYEAIDAAGRARRGVVSAETARLARNELRRLSLTPLSVSAPRERARKGPGAPAAARLSRNELVMATRQLAALVSAATPLEDALGAVAIDLAPPARARLLGVRERIAEGWRLADALAEDGKSFPEVYRAVVAAGETSGDLGGVLERLADTLEKNRAMRDKALGAVVYPLALLVVAGGVVVMLMTAVVPKIVAQFDAFGAKLPAVTRLVVAVSHFLAEWGLVCLGAAVLAGVGAHFALKRPGVRLAFDRRLLRVPVVGGLLRALDGARFARTLSTLVSGGAPLLDALAGARRTVTNRWIGERLGAAITQVREGAGLAAALRRADALPPMLVHLVAAGERAGSTPAMLDRAAQRLEEEFDSASAVALRLLEPAIIVLMGGAVMTIVVAILLPILRLNSLASG